MHPRREALTSSDQRRLSVVAIGLFFLFSALIAQFFRIQVLQSSYWSALAQKQHQISIKIPAKRGVFYTNASLCSDRPQQPVPLVIDVLKFHLFVDPQAIPKEIKPELAEELTEKMGERYRDRITTSLEKKSRNRRLFSFLAKEKKEQVLQWWEGFHRSKKLPRNALYFAEEYQRSYPYGKMLGQILHTVREDRGSRDHNLIPTGGLEFLFDKYLRGEDGKKLLLRSPRNPLAMETILKEPIDGADLFLTIDVNLQAMVEEEIEKAVKRARAKGGWAIMMDPYTGEIFAFAQYPWFDPSRYSHYYNDPEKLEDTAVKAVMMPFEPGSTVKALTIALGLLANKELTERGEEPLFSPEEMIRCDDGRFPGRKFPLKDGRVHRYLNMDLAVQKSSNIYPAKIGHMIVDRLGAEWYRNALATLFCFGEKTGIEIPGESSGRIPRPGVMHPNGKLEWSVLTPATLAIGHNILVTSMQMLKSIAIIANGGYDVHPTLISHIVKTNREGKQEILLDNRPNPMKVCSERRIDPEIVSRVLRSIKFVTKTGGTAPLADVFGYTEAGKTGTSEKIINGRYDRDRNFSSFIGFAPAENPRMILFIGIDEPKKEFLPGRGKMQMGGNCAAPSFRAIASQALPYLGVPINDPYGYPPGDPRRKWEQADWLPEVEAAKELYLEWNNK